MTPGVRIPSGWFVALLLATGPCAGFGADMLSYDHSGNLASRVAPTGGSPNILRQPRDQMARPGELASFSVVVANPADAAFEWRFGGNPVVGGTNDTLLLRGVTALQAGAYSVVVSNSSGSVTSASAALLLDSDGDDLPDDWEMTWFHSLTFQRAAGDPDGDGISNRDEYRDGTNPNDAASARYRLRVLADGGTVSQAPFKESYTPGESVALTATPPPSGTFHGWSGDLVSLANPASVTMDTNKTVLARFACLPAPDGLVALWRGETDAGDALGGHPGTFHQGGTPVAPVVHASGKVGGALDLDGTVHVRIGDAPELRPGEITVEAWVYPTIRDGFRGVLARGSSTGGDPTWLLEVFHGTPRFWSKHAGTGVDVLSGSGVIPLNQWTHLAITFGGGEKHLYQDGVLVSAVGGLGDLVYDASPLPVTLGANWIFGGPAQLFAGRIDEAAIYNRALGPLEVSDLFLSDVAGKCPDEPTISTPARLPDAVVERPYASVSVAGLGTAPYTFSLSAGILPPGLTLSTAGVFGGTPTVPGDYVFGLLATDAGGRATEQVSVLHVDSALAPPGLVGWWRAENNALDAVVDHHGTLRNGAGFATGQVGQGFALDGVDDYLEIPDAPELRPQSLTIEGWVRFNGTAGIQAIAAKPLGTGTLDSFVMFTLPGFLAAVRADGTGEGPYLSCPFNPVLGRWYHVAYTFDHTTLRQALYLNGVEMASGLAAGPIGYDGHSLLLGLDLEAGVPSYPLNGALDEVSLYGRALAATEIAAVHAVGSAGKALVGPYLNGPVEVPAARVGQSYSQTFEAFRGALPYQFGISAGALPAGLTLGAGGVLGGIPTEEGTFRFQVRVTDAAGGFSDQVRSIVVLPHPQLPGGALAWWRAEGDAQDEVGGHHGTLLNGASFGAGKVGQAFALDGTDDSVSVADDVGLRPASVTLETLVRFDSANGTRQVFAKPLGSAGLDSFGVWLANGLLRAGVADGAGFGPVLEVGFNPVLGRWYHLAYTFDDASDRQSLYLDGVRVATGTTTKSVDYDAHPWLIGSDIENGSPAFHLHGRIDEPTICGRALDAVEISELYLAGASGKPVSGPSFVTFPTLPSGRRGIAYSGSLVAQRGVAPRTFTVVRGAVPPGMGFSASGLLSGVPTSVGVFDFQSRVTDASGAYAEQWFALRVDLVSPAQVVARHVFYNQSAWDGNEAGANPADDLAIATDKVALRGGSVAGFTNYTSYRHGLNGLMVDLLGAPGPLTTADFDLRAGNDQVPAGWAAAPVPVIVTVRSSPEAPGTDRVTLIWTNGAITKRWLRVAVLANARTGLATPDIFCFGNAIGETGNSATDARVTAAYALRVLGHVTLAAAIDNPYDHNRDGRVGAADRLLVLGNTSALTPLVLLDLTGGAALAATVPGTFGPGPGELVRSAGGMRVRWGAGGLPLRIWTAVPGDAEPWEIFDEIGPRSGEKREVFLPIDPEEAGRLFRFESLSRQ